MPLVQRVVYPTDIVRIPINKNLKGNDELQHVNMNALIGIIRQLSSLSAHAETLFADLFNEASRAMIKARSMEKRVTLLAQTIETLDTFAFSTDLNKHCTESGRYRPNVVVDQNVVISENRTPCVRDRHSLADAPPTLSVFLREDGKNCTSLYTDPHYFGRTWFAKMQREYESNKRGRTRKHKKHTVNKKEPRPVTVKEYTVDALGNRIVTEARIRKVDQPKSQSFGAGDQDARQQTPPPLQSTEIELHDNLPPPPDFDFPPPFEDVLPAPPVYGAEAPPAPQEEPVYDEPVRSVARAPAAPPAPRAPPAPKAPPAPRPPPPPSAPVPIRQPAGPPPPAKNDEPAAGATAKPQNLLDSIQQYSLNTLKKVTVEAKPAAENHYASMDVMMILSRRPVMQGSDSESEASSDNEWESD